MVKPQNPLRGASSTVDARNLQEAFYFHPINFIQDN